ncbi:adenosylmethionine decarboxylase [Rhizoctonia solani AG-1 IA]|uniref:adenosylmethionine decarboxylase n=2 Tax=Rhizoctonia solani TaxID=456999 RepID=A0A8H7LJJ0_9AGAM|nr:adenosylmethionine decarboxylase [Rhizoctonia solani AG-1 IA]KAF8678348.1 S-adenosylmethionine decarboxylase [Rhizoctonia solani]
MSDQLPHVSLVSETHVADDLATNISPFEGPEKLLEIWFAESADSEVVTKTGNGLRSVPRAVWEEMLDIVKCKVLSVIEGKEMDAYLLSESSFFVSPHKLILKTCGTTLNLYGLPRILDIAAEHCNMHSVYRCFYSRKSFMFPERQLGPHKEWTTEVGYLDTLFKERPGLGLGAGAGYTVGKVNGDHWLLYVIEPEDSGSEDGEQEREPVAATNKTTPPPDYTVEILMSKLGAPARRPFFYHEFDENSKATPHERGAATAEEIGIASILPKSCTTLDSFAFEPCGYSANALVEHPLGEGYYTIHVTPEEGWSYASFECNVPLEAGLDSAPSSSPNDMPTLLELIKRVASIFQPGHLSVTLFVSSEEGEDGHVPPIETAQRVFSRALVGGGYKRTDKINYEFGGYDLAFASFEKKRRVEGEN